MARNRFEQVDEVQPDAINLTLSQHDNQQFGVIHVPKSAAPTQLPTSVTSQEMPMPAALTGAITLANKRKLAIVIIDPERIWNSEWGDLWRYEDPGSKGPNGGPSAA
jgi:hypothetical protein